MSQIESDLRYVEEKIAQAEKEDAQLSGGLVKTLIQLRLAVLKDYEAGFKGIGEISSPLVVRWYIRKKGLFRETKPGS